MDRGKPGSKLHVLSDRAGLPLAVAVSAAHTYDSQALPPLVQAIPTIRSRRGPRRRRPAKLHADKGYDAAWAPAWLRQRGITRRIEPLLAQLFGYRSLATRYERRADLFCGLLTLAAARTRHKRLAT